MLVKDQQGFYKLSSFEKLGIITAFSTKTFGNLSFRYDLQQLVEKRRLDFVNLLNLNKDRFISYLDLSHGTSVFVADNGDAKTVTINDEQIKETDGVITNVSGLSLWILTGDCAPFLFFDPVEKVIGLAHSGWRGTIGKLPLIMVAKMVEIYGCKLKDIRVGIGPSIEKCCYVEKRPAIQESLPEWNRFIAFESEDMIRFDLNGFSIDQLVKIGIKEEHIDWANFCTRDHSDEFFCSQEESEKVAKPGRFATIIQMP